MRAVRLATCALIVISGCTAKQSATESEVLGSSHAMTAPRQRRVHQVSPVIYGSAAHLFKVPILNDSNRAVEFHKVLKSCSCSDAELSKMRLEPGETAELRLSVNLHGRNGPQTFFCELETTEGLTWVEGIHATVHRAVEFVPDSVRFGFVRPGETKSETVVVRSYGRSTDELAQLNDLRVSAGPLTVERAGNDNFRKLVDDLIVRDSYYSLHLTAPQLTGFGYGGLTLDASHSKIGSPLELSVNWNVRSAYDVTPTRLVVKQPAQNTSLTFAVRRHDNKSFAIRAARTPVEGIKVIWRMDGSDAVVSVRTEKLFEKSVWGDIVLETGDESAPEVRLPFIVVVDKPR